MRAAGQLAASILAKVESLIKPGARAGDIDDFVAWHTERAGATSGPLGYFGFPKHCCVSINDVVCHGVPGDQVLEVGDIVNVDITPRLDGWHGDTSRTFVVGGTASVDRLVVTDVAKKCLDIGIRQVHPGANLYSIGRAIETFANSMGCSVVREYGGHDIGREMHGGLMVPHYTVPDRVLTLRPGMCFTIEPMINFGTHEVWVDEKDGWTVRTLDGQPSAQFEHTVLVTRKGVEVLTRA